jgi:hypothetical protein
MLKFISNTLLFEEALAASFFKLADCRQAVNGVSGKAAHRFCNDKADFPVQRILNHLIKAVTPFCGHGRDALVGIPLFSHNFMNRPETQQPCGFAPLSRGHQFRLKPSFFIPKRLAT